MATRTSTTKRSTKRKSTATKGGSRRIAAKKPVKNTKSTRRKTVVRKPAAKKSRPKTRSSQKSASRSRSRSRENASHKDVVHHWTFPQGPMGFHRVEAFALTIVAGFLFLFMWFQFENHFFAASFLTLFFIGVYALVSAILQKMRFVREHYHLRQDHLEIIKVVNYKVKRHVVPFSSIKKVKFDHLFLGGYVVTQDGVKHPLYFNSKEESQKADAHLTKKMSQ